MERIDFTKDISFEILSWQSIMFRQENLIIRLWRPTTALSPKNADEESLENPRASLIAEQINK